jgi:5-methylcytosine-specific restriction endonuclease McrA
LVKCLKRRDKVVEESKQFVWNYLQAYPCVDCGERDPIVLEFDHVRGKKRKIISQLVNSGYGIDVIKKEIAKCEVRCSNCHKRKTAREQGWFRG